MLITGHSEEKSLSVAKEYYSSARKSKIDWEGSLQNEILKREAAEARCVALEAMISNLPYSIQRAQEQPESIESVRIRKLVSSKVEKKKFEQQFTDRESKIGARIMEEQIERLTAENERLRDVNFRLENQNEELRSISEDIEGNLSSAIATISEMQHAIGQSDAARHQMAVDHDAVVRRCKNVLVNVMKMVNVDIDEEIDVDAVCRKVADHIEGTYTKNKSNQDKLIEHIEHLTHDFETMQHKLDEQASMIAVCTNSGDTISAMIVDCLASNIGDVSVSRQISVIREISSGGDWMTVDREMQVLGDVVKRVVGVKSTGVGPQGGDVEGTKGFMVRVESRDLDMGLVEGKEIQVDQLLSQKLDFSGKNQRNLVKADHNMKFGMNLTQNNYFSQIGKPLSQPRLSRGSFRSAQDKSPPRNNIIDLPAEANIADAIRTVSIRPAITDLKARIQNMKSKLQRGD